MPTYTYRRSDGTTFDHFQKMSDDALTEDPETGAPVRRVISGGAGLQFKGTGFYLTDYVKKSGSADSAEPSGESTPKAKPGSTDSGSSKKEPASPKKESAPKPSASSASAAE